MIKGGIGALMKQAQQMQDNMKKAQDQLALTEVEGQSGAGMVKVGWPVRMTSSASVLIRALWTTRKCWKTSLLRQ